VNVFNQIAGMVTLVSFHGALFAAILFVIRFARTSWRETELGRQHMGFMFMIASVLVLTLASYWIDHREWPGWIYLRTLTWVWIFLMISRYTILLFRKQSRIEGGTDHDVQVRAGNVPDRGGSGDRSAA